MDTKPATAGLKLTAPSDADDEKKLPKEGHQSQTGILLVVF